MSIFSLIFAIGLAIVWFRQTVKNWNIKHQSRKLKHGVMSIDGFDKVRDGFDTLILTRPAEAHFNFTGSVKESLHRSLDPKAQETYKITDVITRNGAEMIVIADATVKDFLPTKGSGRYIDKAYPCSMYGFIDKSEHKISFWGDFPDDKRHEHLIKEFAGHIVRFCEHGVAVHQ